jgi:hypothetical protein
MTAIFGVQQKPDLLPVMRHFTIVRGEVWRLPNMFRQFKVLSGCAWVSFGGKDTILILGDTASFDLDADIAVISAMGHSPLVIEVLD